MFKGGKREVKSQNEEFKETCSVAISVSGWMDEELTERYCREVLGVFTLGARRLLAWDSFRFHLTPAVKDLLNKRKTDSAIVPGGCTKYIQAPDVTWYKPMKEYLREMYNLWLADGTHELTTHGNMTAPPRRQVIEGVLEAWKKLLDGSEDDQIVCIRHGPCQNLLEKLKVGQLDDVGSDPFDTEVSEVDMCEEDFLNLLLKMMMMKMTNFLI